MAKRNYLVEALSGAGKSSGRRMVLTDSPNSLWFLGLVVLMVIGGLALVAAAWWSRGR